MCHKFGWKFSESSFLNSGLRRRYVVLLVAKTKAAKVSYLLIIESIPSIFNILKQKCGHKKKEPATFVAKSDTERWLIKIN